MSIRALSIVWEESKATGIDLLVMLALADYTNDKTWWAWPSIDSLAKKSRAARRTVIRALQRMENDLGEIMVDPNSGPNGVNRYQLLLGTKGEITNPPPASEAKSRGDCQSRVTAGHGDRSDGHLAHNPLGTLEEEEEEKSFLEFPSLEEVLKVAIEYPGSMAKGIPAIIPRDWAEYHFHHRTHEKQSWARDWRKAMISLFEIQWVQGQPAARGEMKQNSSRQSGFGFQKKNGARERGEILQELEFAKKNGARTVELQRELETA